MKLYLVRHGRTNYNDLRLCNSDPSVDVHLTPVGVEQAEAMADQLKEARLDRIFASNLKRTQQTAEIVNRFHDLKIEVDARLGDHRSGFEGRPYEELAKALDEATDRWTARFNDGESIEDFKDRVAGFIDELRPKKYDAVLIVSSQWVIRVIAAVVQGISNEEAWELEVAPGSCLEINLQSKSKY